MSNDPDSRLREHLENFKSLYQETIGQGFSKGWTRRIRLIETFTTIGLNPVAPRFQKRL